MLLRTTVILFLLISTLYPQSFKINKIEPPNWWSGLKNTELQLMVYRENLENIKVSSKDKRFKINKITHTKNSSHLFIDISMKNISPGNYELIFSNAKDKIKFN